MKIKGTAVMIASEYIKLNFPVKYAEWIEALPVESMRIINNPVYATDWYSLYDAVIVPTEEAGKLFFDNDSVLAAREIGKYSSEVALKGIYKIFMRIASPSFILSRATSVFSSYYDVAGINVLEKSDKHTVIQFDGFSVSESLIIERIGGWVEKALELTGTKEFKVVVENVGSVEKPIFNLSANW